MTSTVSQTPDPAPEMARGIDAFVLMAIAVVSIAIGAGLNVQAGVPTGLSIGAAAAVYACLGLLHLLLGRSRGTAEAPAPAASTHPEAQHPIYMPEPTLAEPVNAPAPPVSNTAPAAPAQVPRRGTERLEALRQTPAGHVPPAAVPSGRVPPVSREFKAPPPLPRTEPSMPPAIPAAAAPPPVPPALSIPDPVPEPVARPVTSAAAPATGEDPLRDQWSFRPSAPYFEFSGDYGDGSPPALRPAAPAAPAAAPPAQATAERRPLQPSDELLRDLDSPGAIAPPLPTTGLSDVESVEEALRKRLKALVEEGNALEQSLEADLSSDLNGGEALQATLDGALSSSVDALRNRAGTMRQAIEGGSAPDVRPPLPDSHGQAANAPARQIDAGSMMPPPPLTAAAGPPPMPHPGGLPAARLSMIAEAISADRADVFLEPILGLADHRACHYEVTIRLRSQNGGPLEIADSETSLSGTGLLPLFDRVRTLRAASVARRLSERGKQAAVFSGLSSETLSDVAAVNEAARAIGRDGANSAHLMLTFTQADVRAFAAAEWSAISFMRGAGFGFAIGEIVDLDMDFARLVNAGFQFAKLDADVYLDGLPMGEGIVPSRDVCRHLSSLGLTLIVDHIEDEAKVAQIAATGVALGQGPLFGAPRPVKADAMERNAAA